MQSTLHNSNLKTRIYPYLENTLLSLRSQTLIYDSLLLENFSLLVVKFKVK